MVVNINFAHLSNILSSYLVSVADNDFVSFEVPPVKYDHMVAV